MPENKLIDDSLNYTIWKASNLTDYQLNQIIEIEKICKLSRWSKKDYQEESGREDSVLLIAQNNIDGQDESAEIVGFILLRINNTEENKKDAKIICKEADLLNFGVTEKFQKKGIGNSLYNKARLLLSNSNVNSIWLEVRESNTSAIKFYEKRGFKHVQSRKNFYSKPTENALLMKLEL